MLGGYSFWVDKPQWLLLLLLIAPTLWVAARGAGGQSRAKVLLTFIARTIVIILLAVSMAEPNWAKRGEGLSVTILLDRSDSIPLALKQSSVEFLRKATAEKKNPNDCVGVIEIGKDAVIAAMPDPYSTVPQPRDDGPREQFTATNLAAGLRLGLAVMRDDTANRFLLVSDGNETIDSVLAAAEVAKANHVPVDVMVLEYEHDREVIFEQLVAPARARFGQPITLRMTLRAQAACSGRVSLAMNDEVLNLNGPEEGTSMHVDLEPGPAKVIPVTLTLDSPGPHRFDAKFEPDRREDDQIPQNNHQVAVTFVGSSGRVLVVDDGQAQSANLIEALRQSDISVDRQPPEALGGAMELSAYDAVVLANIPRWALIDDQDRALHNYVHDLGGGLVMLGGPQSFGAGRWLGSEVAKALPVKLDPPAMQQLPRGALAIIMHSCEMPQGNYWGERIAIAAIEALSSQDYIGIIDYDWSVGGVNWAFKLNPAGDKSAPIAAAKMMKNGDMPDFGASMQMALGGLTSVRAGKKHVVVITDGDPAPPSNALLQSFIDSNISISTVMIAGHGSQFDLNNLANMANKTGGTPYGEVKNPKALPQIVVKEAQLVSRSLIVEGDTYPLSISRLPGPVEGFNALPPIEGYVLTAAREGLSQVPVVVHGDLQGQPVADPIYAYWNYGLGKSIAYTSDLTGLWGPAWVSWDQFRAFWEKSLRWVMRPSSPVNFMVNTRQEGDLAIVEVEALEGDASFLSYLQTSAVMLGPDDKPQPLALQQIGPGRYRGEFRTEATGAYLVNISYAGGAAGAPGGQPIRGSVQAAVTVPYSAEFRAVKHNRALLEELARRTGGRMIRATDPAMADLFDREQLEVPRSPKRIWDLLAIIAAALFVFDVAVRRLAVDVPAIAALLARLTGRRQEAGTDTVAAWKKARSQVAHRQLPTKTGEKADRAARYEADEADRAAAIDVGAEGSEGKTSEPAAPIRRQPDAAPGAEPEDYTSRLLKAKRRARGKPGEPGAPGPAPGPGQEPGSPPAGDDEHG